MVKRATLVVLALVASPLAAQQAVPAPQSPLLVVPAPATQSRYRSPQVERVKTVDIPQWAKDEGHNGLAVLVATIAPDNRLIALELKQSSGSAAIDAAVRERAENLWYRAGTDTDGNPVESRWSIHMEYARWDKDSPGGGLQTYTCTDLVREHDWFMSVEIERPIPFYPMALYLTAGPIWRMEQGIDVDIASADAEIEARREQWSLLLERCRRNPQRLVLEEVDYPELYARLVDSY